MVIIIMIIKEIIIVVTIVIIIIIGIFIYKLLAPPKHGVRSRLV